ncbi:MAG: Stk1 family PASTA domain-containing Ser/Thr kinase [Clostridia bacterium]|nr:Stk1 family PASTA domain-containing Ser/Thr kinase [Clostridia bacterium]
MATVYRAKCLVLNRYVAVKVLRDEFTTDNEFIKRFNIEAQAAASITHPNIVSVYDVGTEGNLHYIVMELVKGKTLKEIILEDGALAWKWSVKVAMQIASALEMAHRNNIVHRDIKPHNIIITEEGIAKVTDFGIAKAVSNSTITAFGTTIGSVHYFSPEHARGGYTDAKSDLYSLGVVMYEMVTGRVPFDSDTPVSVALKHMQEEPIEPIELKTELPKSVNDIILKAMQKDAEKRYASATEMVKDLEAALKNPNGNFVEGITKADFATQRIDLSSIKKSEGKRAIKEEPEKKGKFAKISKFFEEHKVLKVICIILACVLVFALAMGGTYLALSLGRAKDVQVPNLANLTLDQAKEKVKELNLNVEVKEEKYHLEIPEGQIIEQDPRYQENYKIKEGSTIKVIISKGQEIVKMPKVVGLKRDEAVNLLKETGLEVEVKEENDDKVEKDYIIKQETEDEKEITEGTEIPAGTKIIIYVSMGIEQVEVPDLSGKTESEAKTAITNAKLKWKSTEKVSDSSKPNGVVVNQSISAKSMVDKDTEITITVNEFNEIKNGTITVNVAAILNYTPKTDAEGNEIAPESIQIALSLDGEEYATKNITEDNESCKFSISSTGSKTAKVQIKSTEGTVLTTKTFTYNSGEDKSI